MINYPARASKALGYLKRAYNDVEIFVEDSTAQNVSLFVYRRLLGPKVRLLSINLLGPKQNVLAACRADQAVDGRKKLYIVDGDFELLQGTSVPRLKHFHRLKAYCIENILISEVALLEIALENNASSSPASLKANLDFDNWQSELVRNLGPLFVVYALANMVSSRTPTISLGVFSLCVQQGNNHVLSTRKILSRIRMLMREVVTNAINRKKIRKLRKQISLQFASSAAPHMLISGKDYILPLLFHRMRVDLRFRGDKDELRARLASRYQIDNEPSLARKVRALRRN